MFIIRWILGRIILVIDFMTSPRSPKLTAEQQQQIAEQMENISLYQLQACPFCVKVRRALKRQGVKLPLVDIKTQQGKFREELIQGGGKATVPCLKIDNGDEGINWLYESKDIINYIENRVQA